MKVNKINEIWLYQFYFSDSFANIDENYWLFVVKTPKKSLNIFWIKKTKREKGNACK